MSERPTATHPSPLPVMTILLVSALLAALGIIMVARSSVPAVGWVFLAIGIVGAVYGVLLALKNVQISRAVERRRADDAAGDGAAGGAAGDDAPDG